MRDVEVSERVPDFTDRKGLAVVPRMQQHAGIPVWWVLVTPPAGIVTGLAVGQFGLLGLAGAVATSIAVVAGGAGVRAASRRARHRFVPAQV